MGRTFLSRAPESIKSHADWRRRILLEMALLTLVCAFGALGVLRAVLHLRASLAFENEGRALGERLIVKMLHNEPLGATRTLGAVSLPIKNLLQRKSPPGASDVPVLLDRVRRDFGAAMVCVMDREGNVAESSPAQGGEEAAGSGKCGLSACFKAAIRGADIVYPSADIWAKERGICYASPISPVSPGADGDTAIGVIGMKMPMEPVDLFLGDRVDPAAVVSPLGIVFSCNRPDWLFHRAFDIGDGAMEAMLALEDAVFQLRGKQPPRLPFSLDGSRVRLQGRIYAVGSQRLPLSDAFGTWRLIVLRDMSSWVPAWLAAVTLLGVALVGSGLTVSILNRGRDRYEKARSRRLLEETEARWRAILESVHAAIITVDARSHVIVDVNRAAVRMIGIEREQIVGRVCHQFICSAPAGQCPITDMGRKSIYSEESVLLGRHRNVPVLKTVTQVHLDGREHLLHSFVDISALKSAQEQVSIFRRCVEASGQGFGMATLDGEITYVNPTMWGLLGIERPEEVQGQPFVRFYPPDLVPRFYKEVLPAIMRRGMWTGEMPLASRDGNVIPTIDHFFIIRDEDGKPHSLGFAITDISEQTRAAENLKRAREEAEEANRAKSEFLANMSHEIRTPMNAIIGMTDLALETELSAEQREYLQTVKLSANSLLRLLNDILDFSKIEAGKLDLSPISFDLHDCVNDTMRTLGGKAGQKRIDLTCRIDDEVPNTMEGDPGRLRQVLINLVGNAIKFTEAGEVAVLVKKESETEETVDLRFVVQDTGIGVPADKHATIFESFAQADGSTTRGYGGTGLGLAICKQLVEMMGGRIWVESPASSERGAETAGRAAIGGPGSSFYFTVRMGKRKRVPEVRKAGAEDLKNLPVLIVDDSATNRRMLIEMLSSWGMRPTAVSDGEEALRTASAALREDRPYRVILLDGKMPDTDGYTLAARLREVVAEETSIMMLTSVGERGDAARCRELGIEGYLLKPAGRSELLDGILNLVARVGRDREAPLITRHWLRSRRRPLKILLAEDNPVNQKLAVSILARRRHKVEVVGTGREAIDRLKQEEYDLVLMDVQMPGMDGIAATREIRDPASGVRDHGVPVVAMTAHAMDGDRQRCLEGGMNDYVAKPIETEVLLAAIERVMEEKRGLPPVQETRVRGRRAVFDKAAILRNADGDVDLVKEVVSVYLESYPEMLSGIGKAIEDKSAADLERAAHTLKGSLGNLGAKRATDAALKLERIARDNRMDAAPREFQRLEEELERLRTDLEHLIEGV